MAAFMVSREKKVWWRSASRMRVWDGLDAALDQPLVGGPVLARRQHCDPVMERELPEARIEPDIVAVGIVHA